MKNTRSIRILSVILSLLMVIGILVISRGAVLADTLDPVTGLTYTISEGKATITRFTAPAGFSGVLNIPETLGGATVTSFTSTSLKNHSELTSISIPSGVTSISEEMFDGCIHLEVINIDRANPYYKSTDDVLYSKDGTILLFCPEGKTGSFSIPSGVTDIWYGALEHCRSLTHITIPSSVNSIGLGVFSSCDNLISISVKTANPTFKSADGVLYSKDGTQLIAFPGGKSGSFTIPESVTSIGGSTFSGCIGLTGITIPGSVSIIEPGAFSASGNILSISVNTANPNYKSIDGVLYSKDGTQLIAFPGGKSGSFIIPNSVMSIESSAFLGCIGLTSVVIPNSVTNVDMSAFYECSSLSAAYFFGNAPTLGSFVFNNCTSDFTVRYLSTSTGFGDQWNGYLAEPFSSYTDPVTGLKYSFAAGKATVTGFSAPSGFSGALAIPSSIGGLSVTRIANDAFANCTSLTSISIPGSVTGIGDGAFSGCTGLVSIGIPENVTSIGNGAFSNCPNLSDATFSGNAPTMGTDVFAGSASDFIVSYVNTATGFTNPWNGYTALPLYTAGVSYRTHVQDVGWQGYVSDGAASGTSGQSKRLEAINIKLDLEGIDGSIEYRTHVQDIGWQGWVADDALSGTSGQSKRLEAIQIRLTGDLADAFDVYYRVHAQNVGWMGWAKNGQSSGTAGHSYRLEAIEIKLVLKGDPAPGSTAWSFIDKYEPANTVNYKTHVQDIGWQDYVRNGATSGTSGQSKRLEGIQIKLNNIEGGIEYRTHVQDYGWMAWASNDAMSGTSGQSKRLEAIEIRLTGKAAENYDIYYCVHAQNVGWLDWAKNGQASGTAGFGYRLEAIQIVLVPKGGPAPGMMARAFVQG